MAGLQWRTGILLCGVNREAKKKYENWVRTNCSMFRVEDPLRFCFLVIRKVGPKNTRISTLLGVGGATAWTCFWLERCGKKGGWNARSELIVEGIEEGIEEGIVARIVEGNVEVVAEGVAGRIVGSD